MFEQLFKDQIKADNGHQVDRIQRNIEGVELTHGEAIRFDHAEVAFIKAMLAGMGAAIDTLADEPRLQVLALAEFPRILAANMSAMKLFVDTVTLTTLIDGPMSGFNEDRPDCDCTNCRAGRAMSKLVMEANSAEPRS